MGLGNKAVIDFSDYIGGESVLQDAARAVRSLKKDVDALTKTVDVDGGRVRKALADIDAAIASVGSRSGGLLKLDPAEKKILNELVQQFGELKAAKEGMNAVLASQKQIQAGLSEATRQYTSELAKQKQALRDAVAAGDVEGQRAAATAIRATATETKELSAALRGANSTLSAARGSYDELTASNSKLLTKLRGLEGGLSSTSKEAQGLRAQIAKNNDTLLAFDKAVGISYKNVGNYPSVLKKAEAGLVSFAQQAVGSFFALQAIANAFVTVFKANLTYSDQLSDVQKTTNLTTEATDRLADSLKQIDTRTSLQGLLDIAAVGGQLGIAGKDIEDFTKAIDIANAALSDDFKGSAAEIAEELGKIRTVFSKQLSTDVSKDLLDIGSALNQLAADGAATAPQLADVALRTGAVAASAGLGLDKVLAYASVLQELGFTSEVSGTALNRLFGTLSTRSKASFDIAKLGDANLTLKQFKDLVNNDFGAAVQAFLRGLREGGTSTTKFNSLLGTLKLQSGEAKAVITALAQNIDLYTERQETANEQLRIGTSLSAEAAIKQNNLAGSWAKLTNDVSNFFTGGTANAALKWLVDAARASINLSGGIGETARRFAQGIGITKAPVDDLGKSVADLAIQQRAAADETEHLLAKFASLKQASNPTELNELRGVVAALREKFGDSVVTLNQQTGAFDLNTAAVNKNYKAQRAAYQESVVTLAKRLQGLEDERSKSFALADALQKEADLKRQAALAGTNLPADTKEAELRRVLDQNARQRAATPKQYDASEGALSQATLANYARYIELNDQAGAAAKRFNTAQQQGEGVLKQLARLGLSGADALTYLLKAQTEATKKTDDSVEADKKKKQSVADVMKAEYELQKQRLEAQAKDYDRQAENVANTDEIRVRAAQKAVEARKQIAKLDELEQLHEAELKNAKLVDGDKALAIERVTITEKMQERIKDLEFDGKRAIVAIKQAGADQLIEIQKQQLDSEAKALEATAANENENAQVRQQALLDASAKRIEIIQLESAIKRRAAKGDAEVLTKIQDEEDAATAEELRKTRNNNADLGTTDLAKKYTASQLALEKSRAAGLFTEKQYAAEVERLELAQLEKRLEILQKDKTKQQEAADLEVEINRRKNDQKAKSDQEAAEKRAKLAQYVEEQIGNIGTYYFQLRQQQLDAETENQEAAKQAELNAAGSNEALKKQIGDKYAKLETERKRKQFEQDKEAALFQIALNTAMAVTSVLSTGGGTRYADFGISAGILTALVIANGIAQAALVLAKPTPYFKGRRGGPLELAEVGERGPELIERVGKAGSARYEYASERMYTVLQRGDNVFTAAETQKMLAPGGILSQRDGETMAVAQAFSGAAQAAAGAREAREREGLSELAKGQRDIVQAIKNFKPTTVNVHRGSEADITTSESITRWMNQRLGRR